MAFYLNPKEGPREWLYNNAMSISVGEAGNFHNWSEEALLCLVDTGTDLLLGIAYDDAEIKAFAWSDEPKQWYVCSRKIAERCYGSARPWERPYE